MAPTAKKTLEASCNGTKRGRAHATTRYVAKNVLAALLELERPDPAAELPRGARGDRLLSGLLTKAPHLTSSQDQLGLLSVGSLSGIFSALAGIMLITSEYRHGTIRPTSLVSPRRSRVLAAKLAVSRSSTRAEVPEHEQRSVVLVPPFQAG